MGNQIIATIYNKNVPQLKPTRVKTFKNWDEVAKLITYEGILLKFSGCRDGRGYRVLQEITHTERQASYREDGIWNYRSYPSYNILGRKVSIRPHYKKGVKGIVKIDFLVEPYLTTNYIEKLQAYYDEVAKEFVKIKVPKK
jgi:hypothetical protein